MTIQKEDTTIIEQNKELVNKYPFLYSAFNGAVSDADKFESTWQDDLPEGWKKAFCPQIWDELKAILEKANFLNEFKFVQIKEKWGTLRLYHNGVPESIFDEITAWEEKYEKLSENICINCGKPAEYMSVGWILFYCKDCAAHNQKTAYQERGYLYPFIPLTDLDTCCKLGTQKYLDTHPTEKLWEEE